MDEAAESVAAADLADGWSASLLVRLGRSELEGAVWPFAVVVVNADAQNALELGKQPIVLLKTAEGNRYLPIWIGHPEAAAILMKLQGADAPRPLTHDLLVNILGELDVEVVRVTVTELRENAFHASITVGQNGNELEIDARSSDAIAVAVRARAPIFAADDVIEESAIEMEADDVNEEEIVTEFRSFLDHVSAADFAEAAAEEEDAE